MLKKENRLSQVRLKHFITINSPLFTVKYTQNNLNINRFAFVISKKIDKRATKRNFLKRKISSCIEEIFDRIVSGNDFVFYPKTSALEIERDKLLNEIIKSLPKKN